MKRRQLGIVVALAAACDRGAAAPPTPATFGAEATTPFAVRLRWDAEGGTPAGFEIESVQDGKSVRVAIVNPTAREFVHHLRMPGTSYAYRILSFNAHGPSAPSALATARTPTLAALPKPAASLSACTRMPPELDLAKLPNRVPRQTLGSPGGPALYADGDRNEMLRRHLFGEYAGCLRELGAFDLQDGTLTPLPGLADEGFPVLRAIAGAGQYEGAQVRLLRFSGGRYEVADDAHFCGEPYPDPDRSDPNVGTKPEGGDLGSFAPPFDTCQRDLDF